MRSFCEVCTVDLVVAVADFDSFMLCGSLELFAKVLTLKNEKSECMCDSACKSWYTFYYFKCIEF